MAVPVITRVIPSTGPPGGQNVIHIEGNDFRLPPAPAASGPINAGVPRTVRVRFAAETSARVDVLYGFLLRVRVPPYRGTGAAAGADPIPAVAVEVVNLDDAGVPIAGETTTVAGAYTYAREGLRAPGSDHYLTLVAAELRRTLQRQVLPEVIFLRVHPDYAEPGQTLSKLSRVPALVITSFDLDEDRDRDPGYDERVAAAGTRRVERFWPSRVYRVGVGLLGVADRVQELHNLSGRLVEAVMRTPNLEVDEPTLGRLQHPLVLIDPPGTTATTDFGGVVSFTARLEIRDVALELAGPVDAHGVVQQFQAALQQGIVAGPLPTDVTI